MLFSPPWRATQRVVALGDRGGDGEGLEGQRSTTAKRHIYWPKCWLHSLTSGPLQALGPDLSWLHLPRAASSSQGSQRGQLTGQAWSCTVRTGSTAGRRLIRHLDSWERRSSAFVAAPPLSKYSKLFTPRRAFSLLQHIVYGLTFLSWCRRGGIAARATEQTVEKGGCHLYPVPRRTCLFIFLFELQAVELSPEFDVRKLN